MKLYLTTTLLSMIALTFACPAEPGKAPFESVVARGEKITATLPAGLRLLVGDASSDSHLSALGDAFTFTKATDLRLTERHSTYYITARFTPEVGLQVYAILDARSIGGQITKKHYFIPATEHSSKSPNSLLK